MANEIRQSGVSTRGRHTKPWGSCLSLTAVKGEGVSYALAIGGKWSLRQPSHPYRGGRHEVSHSPQRGKNIVRSYSGSAMPNNQSEYRTLWIAWGRHFIQNFGEDDSRAGIKGADSGLHEAFHEHFCLIHELFDHRGELCMSHPRELQAPLAGL